MRYIYHRGKRDKDIYENTFRGLMNAINSDDSSGVEFDIRMTRDEKIVIIHDKTINRTSNGSGRVSDMSYEELKKFNFSSNKYPESILLLEEFLKLVDTNKILLIELKTEIKEDLFIYKVNEILEKYANLNIYISSFNDKILKKLKKINQSLKIGLIIWFVKISEELKMYDFLEIRQTNINDEINDFLINNNQELILWNVLNKNKNEYNALMIIDNLFI